jgi:hypothetical protein
MRAATTAEHLMRKLIVFVGILMSLVFSYDVRHLLGAERLYSLREEGYLHVSERFLWEMYIGRCRRLEDQTWLEQVRSCEEQLDL